MVYLQQMRKADYLFLSLLLTLWVLRVVIVDAGFDRWIDFCWLLDRCDENGSPRIENGIPRNRTSVSG